MSRWVILAGSILIPPAGALLISQLLTCTQFQSQDTPQTFTGMLSFTSVSVSTILLGLVGSTEAQLLRRLPTKLLWIATFMTSFMLSGMLMTLRQAHLILLLSPQRPETLTNLMLLTIPASWAIVMTLFLDQLIIRHYRQVSSKTARRRD